MVTVLLAPDKFKGSLTAAQVADAVAAGLRDVDPTVTVISSPVADGGDGTLAAAVAAGYRPVPVTVPGPTGEPVDSGYAVADNGTAVVELADACGLDRLPGRRLDALGSSSAGVGAVIRAALDAGVRNVVLGIGGSASTDGGAGLVTALGARLLDADGAEIPSGGAGLERLDRIDLSGLHPAVADTAFVVACDVDNPLLGPNGAAAVYGPQKGAGPDDVARLDAALTHWSGVLSDAQGHGAAGHPAAATPGAGAAGGVGFAALAVLGAHLRPGIELVLDLTGFHDRLPGADLVVTGEGALDTQTLSGKAPAGVAAAAVAAGVPVVAVAGANLLDLDTLREAGIQAAYTLVEIEPDVATCVRNAAPLLRQAARRLAAEQLTAPASSP
ncbi:glycerate kinase [Nakamurella flava]|uniref:Glycerate kinase n=1 Tax=Nakamurella flava TaxID=2576308 RepID=A0A4U6QJH5_9ACTN|nr:glycerate kinase [Nakamurella flava]TKV60627.1 glycerate kinase [Nakamurella flava]